MDEVITCSSFRGNSLVYASAMANNSNVVELSLVGTRSSDSIALELAESLKSNKTLQKLNLETNYLSAKGVKAIIAALNESGNTALVELKRVDGIKNREMPKK